MASVIWLSLIDKQMPVRSYMLPYSECSFSRSVSSKLVVAKGNQIEGVKAKW